METDILNEEFEVPKHLLDLGDLIEFELDNTKLDKRSQQYKRWKVKMNELISLFNKLSSFQAYNKLK